MIEEFEEGHMLAAPQARLLLPKKEVGSDGGIHSKIRLLGGQLHQRQPLLPAVPTTPEQLVCFLLPPVNISLVNSTMIQESCGYLV